ncbi:hypothetical protein [Escherichia coli]|uniref:hypothetical protein n=1 Tax=Escherichia coli TaxID=562 RepID=UPI002350E33B|nr:hypothetical protein [Escherichia coli]MDC7934878.1 hypothetical protein [Escherichia coli]
MANTDKKPTDCPVVIVDDSYEKISPNAMKLLHYLLINPAEVYSTDAIRRGMDTDEKRQLKPYFEELRDLGLLTFTSSYGEVQVTMTCRTREIEAWGLTVLERC